MKNSWQKWMVIAKKFGNVQANILLSLVYIIIILPLGLIFNASGKFQPGKTKNSSYWIPKKKTKQDLTWARKQ